MRKNSIKLLLVTTFLCIVSIGPNRVYASPQDDINVLTNKISILENQLEELTSQLNEQENSIDKTKTEIDKRDKIITNVKQSLDKTEERQKKSIEDLANKLTTNLIENKTKSLLSGEKELADLSTHPLSFSLLENKTYSNIPLENEILKETDKVIKEEKNELIKSQETIATKSEELLTQKEQIELDIESFKNEISKIETEIKQAEIRERIRQKYGINVSGNNASVVETALQYLGTPYVWGGTSPGGFDCSGLMQYVYAKNGVYLSRTTYTQIYDGTQVSVADLQPGDLIFPNADHVGMYIGNGQMIHAPQPGDVVKISGIGSVWKAVRVK